MFFLFFTTFISMILLCSTLILDNTSWNSRFRNLSEGALLSAFRGIQVRFHGNCSLMFCCVSFIVLWIFCMPINSISLTYKFTFPNGQFCFLFKKYFRIYAHIYICYTFLLTEASFLITLLLILSSSVLSHLSESAFLLF